MNYKYLDDIAVSDVAFRAWGNTPEEMFSAAADAMMNAMVEDLDKIENQVRRPIDLQEDSMDMLLFEFLQELIFFKDAALLLLRPSEITITQKDGIFTLHAETFGETLNAEKHELLVDVKAVTLHKFMVDRTAEGWEARVILDT